MSKTPEKKPPHRLKRFTEDQVAEALKKSGGIIADAARLLSKTTGSPVARSTISTYVSGSERLQRLATQITEATLDLAESRLMRAVEAGQPWAIQFFLNTKGRERGYVKRNEVVGRNGGPVQTQTSIEIENLDLQDVLALEAIMKKAAAGGRDAAGS